MFYKVLEPVLKNALKPLLVKITVFEFYQAVYSFDSYLMNWVLEPLFDKGLDFVFESCWWDVLHKLRNKLNSGKPHSPSIIFWQSWDFWNDEFANVFFSYGTGKLVNIFHERDSDFSNRVFKNLVDGGQNIFNCIFIRKWFRELTDCRGHWAFNVLALVIWHLFFQYR